MPLVQGPARKVGLVFVGLTGATWILTVIGFGVLTQANATVLRSVGLAPYWIVSLGGVPTIALAAAFAIFSSSRISKILGVITSFFSTIFLLATGMIMYYSGSAIIVAASRGLIFHSINLLFVAALLASLFWTIFVASWHFFETDDSEDYSRQHT